MGNVYFIGDTHFDHKAVLGFSRGQFSSIEEHNEALVEYWNDIVKPRDLVWHLGDVAFSEYGLTIVGRLNGEKRLIMGNHDKYGYEQYSRYFKEIHGVTKRYGVVMTHVPIHPNQLEYRWTHNVHGHIHNPDEYTYGPEYINVNADAVGLKPVSLDWVRNKMEAY